MQRLIEGRHLLEGGAYFNMDTQWCETRGLLDEIRYSIFNVLVITLFKAFNQKIILPFK